MYLILATYIYIHTKITYILGRNRAKDTINHSKNIFNFNHTIIYLIIHFQN